MSVSHLRHLASLSSSSSQPSLYISSSNSSDSSAQGFGLKTLQPEFKKQVQALIDDGSLTDDDLYKQAQKLILVLLDDRFGIYNKPAWISRARTGRGRNRPDDDGYSTSRMLNAMLAAADDLQLSAGRRYVSAAVCACALEAVGANDSMDGSLGDHTEAERLGRLAQMLEGLANTWVAFLLWPCESRLCFRRHTVHLCMNCSQSTK